MPGVDRIELFCEHGRTECAVVRYVEQVAELDPHLRFGLGGMRASPCSPTVDITMSLPCPSGLCVNVLVFRSLELPDPKHLSLEQVRPIRDDIKKRVA